MDAPALIQEDRVYLGTKDGFVVCLNAQTGEKKWSYETMGEIVGAPNIAAYPKDGRPLLLVGSYDNFIHCLEAKDGNLLWKFETMNYINGTPAVWGKEAVVFGDVMPSSMSFHYSMVISSGRQIWVHRLHHLWGCWIDLVMSEIWTSRCKQSILPQVR